MRIRALSILAWPLLALTLSLPGHAQTHGLFADFDTSMGSFTCSLDFSNAPMTSANFIGLAAGERNWLNHDTGKVERRPFYEDLIFHRVVSNFVIQAGSPDGDGSGGPGYAFRDEFSTHLLHDAVGVLSMANSGLNANGSQFFITLAVTPQTMNLDSVHSVFGRVTAGLNVVQAIGRVPVDAQEKPLDDVVIHHVEIRRVGAAADAFDIHAYGLPQVQPANARLHGSGPQLELELTRERDHEYWLYATTNFTSWFGNRIGLYIEQPPTNALVIVQPSTTLGSGYTVADIFYPGPLYTPRAIANQTFSLLIGTDVLYLGVDSSGMGNWLLTDLPGNVMAGGIIQSSQWGQDAYRGTLVVDYEGNVLDPMRITFAFGNATSGNFRGTVFSDPASTISGPFVLIP